MESNLLKNKKPKQSRHTWILAGAICIFCILLFYGTRILLSGFPAERLPITDNLEPGSSLNMKLVYQDNKDIGYAEEITIEGTSAYVSGQYGSGIYILNVSEPERPILEGIYNPTDFVFRNMKAQSNYLYLDTGILEILDTNAKNNPVAIWQFETEEILKNIVPTTNYLYVTGSNINFYIIDIANPKESKLAKVIKKFNNLDYIEYATTSENLLFVVYEGLYIFDISNPLNPVEIGFYGLPFGIDYFDNVVVSNKTIWVRGKYKKIFGLGDPQSEILLLDISDPSKPTLISTYDHYPFAVFKNIICFYNTSNSVDSFHLMDFTDPKKPVELGYISDDYDNSLGYPRAMIMQNDFMYIYLANYSKGINIIKFSPPDP